MVRRVLYLGMVLVFAVSFSGCLLLAGAAGGAGTAVWLSNKLSDDLNVSRERAVEATKDVLKSMDMVVLKEVNTEEVTQIRSKYVDGSSVWIDIRPLTESSSKVEVRVGIMGDEQASAEILEKIKNSF